MWNIGNFLNVQAQISWINYCTTHSKIPYNYSERIKKDFYETDTEGFPEDIIKREKKQVWKNIFRMPDFAGKLETMHLFPYHCKT